LPLKDHATWADSYGNVVICRFVVFIWLSPMGSGLVVKDKQQAWNDQPTKK